VMIRKLTPKSPEPTAVLSGLSFGTEADGAGRVAVTVPASGWRGLSFLR
jgi:hypothetical protein